MLAHNNRILLVDDAPRIHEDFRKILAQAAPAAEEPAGPADLVGELPPAPRRFQLDSAFQGSEALQMVRRSLAEGRPYAMAFIDMRMPPGWDGVETIAQLWNTDPDLQVVICTAFSDRSWEDALARLDVRDRLLVLKKPFDIVEVRQLAQTVTTKWSLARESAQRLAELDQTIRQLRASEAALMAAQQDLEGFAHAVAHDLRSPIAVVASFSSLLALEVREPQKAARMVERIQANANVACELLSGLFSLTHIAKTEVRPQRVDLGAMVRQVISELRVVHPLRQVRVEVPPDLHVQADPRLVQVAVRNLVENAWKFTAQQELARIEVGQTQRQDGESVYFVRDNGCGFDMLQRDKLFRSFQRLHDTNDYPGTGLGLVTVSRAITRHGGEVWAESQPGQGSTFYFTLPAPGATPPRHAGAELATVA